MNVYLFSSVDLFRLFPLLILHSHCSMCIHCCWCNSSLNGLFLVIEKKDLKALFCFFSSPFVALPCQKDTCKLLLSVEHASIFSFTVFVLLYIFTVSFTVQTLGGYMQDATILSLGHSFNLTYS